MLYVEAVSGTDIVQRVVLFQHRCLNAFLSQVSLYDLSKCTRKHSSRANFCINALFLLCFVFRTFSSWFEKEVCHCKYLSPLVILVFYLCRLKYKKMQGKKERGLNVDPEILQ